VTVVNVWAAETERFDYFGSDLKMLGDLLVVGSEGDESFGFAGASAPGGVVVFRHTGTGAFGGYAQESSLRPAPVSVLPGGAGVPTGKYGFAVDACVVPGSDTFVVGGAPYEGARNPADPNRDWIRAGAAYVHRRDAASGVWSLDGRLAVPDPRDYAYGGVAVGIACEASAVPGDPPTVEAVVWVDTRFVVWHRDAAGAWSMRQTTPFGVGALPVSGVTDVFVVSAPGPAATRPVLAMIGGQWVDVLRRSGPEGAPWTAEAMLSSPLTGPNDFYGRAIAIDRDLIVVGTEYDPPSGPYEGGRAHVYRYTGTGPFGGWEEEAVLTPAVPRDRFGGEVAVYAGAAGDGVGARVAVRSARGVTTFRREAAGVWREEVLIESGAGPTYPWAGVLGGMDSRYLAFGNYIDNTRGTEAGIVHLLDLRSVVAAEDAPGDAAQTLAVSGPNPARARTEVTLTLAEAASVMVGLFDALGRRVAVLHEGALAAGVTEVAVELSGMPPGVYVVRATVGSQVASARLVVAR
jgi:hypothetical protein